MCDNCCGKHGGKLLIGLIFGLAAGAAGYYFLNNTERGRQVKREIKKKGELLADNLGDLAEEIEDRGVELKKAALKIEDEIEKKVDQGVDQVKEKVDEQLDHLTELQDRVESLRDRGRKAVKFFTSSGKKLT